MKPIVLRPSFSRWDNFANCERLYALDILYPDDTKNRALLVGIQVHGMLEAFAKHVRALDGNVNQADADFAERDLAKVYVGPLKTEKLRPYLKTVADLLLKWEGRVMHVEEWIRSVRDLPFSGKADLVVDVPGEGLTVIDYKTCNTLSYARNDYSARRSLQLMVYCLAWEVSRAAFLYLPPSGEGRLVSVAFTPEELEVAYKRLQALWHTIKKRWISAGANLTKNHQGFYTLSPEQKDELDLEVFALASSDFKFCSEKCRQAERCPLFSKDT